MPDVCDLILDEHGEFRRRFAEMDVLRAESAERSHLQRVWVPLAQKLEVHASAEEDVFYPRLLNDGRRGEEETADAIDDHNKIREAIRRAEAEEVGTGDWWDAVLAARESNSDHMAEEERGALPDFRVNSPSGQREEMGAAWIGYENDHAGARAVEAIPENKDRYMARNRTD